MSDEERVAGGQSGGGDVADGNRVPALGLSIAALAAAWSLAGEEASAARACRAIPEAVNVVVALNDFWQRSFRLCQAADASISASAYPDVGVVRANRRWLAEIADQYGPSAATGILAHEWGHMVQGGEPGPGAELQADCLAGAFMRRAGFSAAEVGEFVMVSLDSGDSRWGFATHGTGSQRRQAILRGYNGFRGQVDRRFAADCRH
jgi:hypothetical protein